jgi:hypothetical protein
MLDDLIVCRILTGGRGSSEQDPANLTYLPRTNFEHGTKRGDLRVGFKRTQFPVRLSFAMTINKAQGQTLTTEGLDLFDSQVFSHGQLYTAFSRVPTSDSIRVLSNWTGNARGLVVNIVDPRVLIDNSRHIVRPDLDRAEQEEEGPDEQH